MKKSRIQIYTETMIWGIVAFIVVVSVYGYIRDYPGYDDTDDEANRIRSGMMLFTDYGTGCQYLASRAFLGYTTLIQRKDRDGFHVCNGSKQ